MAAPRTANPGDGVTLFILYMCHASRVVAAQLDALVNSTPWSTWYPHASIDDDIRDGWTAI
jgi:hypothetical protein